MKIQFGNIVGALLNIIAALWNAIKFGGNVDFMVERYQDPSWIETTFLFLLDPLPSLILTVGLISVGLGLIYWSHRLPAVESVLEELGALVSEGVQLRNQVQYRVRTHNDLIEWCSHEGAWESKAVLQVKKVSAVWASYIHTIDRPVPFKAVVANPIQEMVDGIEHQLWADIQNERVVRLGRFMRDPHGVPPPSQPESHNIVGRGGDTIIPTEPIINPAIK